MLHFAGGHSERSRPEMLLTPTTAAERVELDGPWHMVGAALSPLSWAALTRLHVGEHSECVLGAAACRHQQCAQLPRNPAQFRLHSRGLKSCEQAPKANRKESVRFNRANNSGTHHAPVFHG